MNGSVWQDIFPSDEADVVLAAGPDDEAADEFEKGYAAGWAAKGAEITERVTREVSELTYPEEEKPARTWAPGTFVRCGDCEYVVRRDNTTWIEMEGGDALPLCPKCYRDAEIRSDWVDPLKPLPALLPKKLEWTAPLTISDDYLTNTVKPLTLWPASNTNSTWPWSSWTSVVSS